MAWEGLVLVLVMLLDVLRRHRKNMDDFCGKTLKFAEETALEGFCV